MDTDMADATDRESLRHVAFLLVAALVPANTEHGVTSTVERFLILKILRRRVVARIDRVRQEYLFVIRPELAHARIGLDDRVHQLPILALAASHEYVADDIAILIELDRSTRGVGDRDLVQGLGQSFAVITF